MVDFDSQTDDFYLRGDLGMMRAELIWRANWQATSRKCCDRGSRCGWTAATECGSTCWQTRVAK
jgi:hypothetical protein